MWYNTIRVFGNSNRLHLSVCSIVGRISPRKRRQSVELFEPVVFIFKIQPDQKSWFGTPKPVRLRFRHNCAVLKTPRSKRPSFNSLNTLGLQGMNNLGDVFADQLGMNRTVRLSNIQLDKILYIWIKYYIYQIGVWKHYNFSIIRQIHWPSNIRVQTMHMAWLLSRRLCFFKWSSNIRSRKLSL